MDGYDKVYHIKTHKHKSTYFIQVLYNEMKRYMLSSQEIVSLWKWNYSKTFMLPNSEDWCFQATFEGSWWWGITVFVINIFTLFGKSINISRICLHVSSLHKNRALCKYAELHHSTPKTIILRKLSIIQTLMPLFIFYP